MSRCFVLLRGWEFNVNKIIGKLCLFFLFCLLLDSIIAVSDAQWGPTIHKEPNSSDVYLRPGESQKFKIRAQANLGNFIESIEFSADGQTKNNKDSCNWPICGKLEHSITYKWNELNFSPYQVVATVGTSDREHTVVWNVYVRSDQPEIKKSVPLRKQLQIDVGESLAFKIEASSDSGIEYIKFSSGGQSTKHRGYFAPFVTPSASAKYVWNIPGLYTVTAAVGSKTGGMKTVEWSIRVGPPNQVPMIERLSPSTQSVTIQKGAKKKFRVQATDPDGSINYKISSIIFSEDNNSQLDGQRIKNFGSNWRHPYRHEVIYSWYFPGTYEVRAVVIDGGGRTDSVTWDVTVPEPNRAPMEVGAIPRQTLTSGGSVVRLDLSNYFQDPDKDKLTYTARSDNMNIVLPQVVDTRLIIHPRDAVGSTTVKVTASDGKKYVTRLIFVTVTGSSPDQIVAAGPDLVVQSISVSKSLLAPGEDFTLSTQVQNIGTGDAGHTSLRYSGYGPEVNRKRATVPRLAANAVSPEKSITLKAPNVEDSYVYEVCIGSVRNESNINNNCATVTINVGPVPGQEWTPEPIQNRGPERVGQISNQTMRSDSAGVRLELSNYFRDADGDNLRYTTTLDNPNVAFLQVVGTSMDIYPLDAGSTNVTVTASDGSSVARQSFSITVSDTLRQNQSPRTVGTISNRSMTQVAGATLGVSGYFSDPDGDTLTYTARSDNTNVVTVSIGGTYLTLNPVRAGSANVTVTASDGSLTATQRFSVRIGSVQTQNQTPRTIGTIPTRSMTVGAAGAIQVSGYFSDPDGDSLAYTARSDNMNIVTTFVSGDYLTLTPVGVGSATVTVTASDGSSRVTQHFTVAVGTKPETIPSLAVCDRTPQIRDKIMVMARVRSCADVTEEDLESIKRLSIIEKGISTLKQGDFDELRNLEELVLKGNYLRTLPEEVFWYLRNLRELSLRDNQFTTLAENAFNRLDNLTYLSLRGNQLTTLRKGVFDDLDNVVELDLRENQLTTLPAGVFEDLPSLQELYLEDNRIDTLSRGAFSGLSNLEDLELDGNPLSTIKAGAFNGLSSLTDLDFNNFPLRRIEAGAFNGLSSLTDLELGNTQLSTLPSGVFSGLSSLEDLELYGNPVRTIEVGAFTGLSGLRSLDLSDTQLSTLPRGVFSGLSGLEDLDLDGNSLYTIETGAFNGLSNLTSLDLGENQLTMLPVGIFSGLNNLTQLGLDENQFTTLPADIFSGLSRLTHLNLRENQLTALPASMFKDLSNLTYLNLQDNPGAPFTLTLELTRTDNTDLTALGPATIKVKGAEGAPFAMSVSLSVRGGILSATTATIPKGGTESNAITVTQNGASAATVSLGTAPIVPSNYSGIRTSVGNSLILFSPNQGAPTRVSTVIPEATALLPSFPNPFNPETWIPYQLSKDAEVTVSIYSVNGNLVRTLDLGHRSAGMYRSRSRAAYWDGCNALGEPVASGVYFYTFTAGDFTATRKMLIRK